MHEVALVQIGTAQRPCYRLMYSTTDFLSRDLLFLFHSYSGVPEPRNPLNSLPHLPREVVKAHKQSRNADAWPNANKQNHVSVWV